MGPIVLAPGKPDVEITRGFVPQRLSLIETETVQWQANASELVLDIPKVARFHVHGGRKVFYDPVPGASDESIGAYLLGSCLGAIFYQRGLAVIHGAAIVHQGAGAVICGKSGAGKSTTSAFLVARGARLLSDDLAVFIDAATATVVPGYPQSKLSPDLVERLAIDSEGTRPLNDERGKLAVSRLDVFVEEPQRIKAIFVLEKWKRQSLEMARLSAAEAIHALTRQRYRRHYVVGSQTPSSFERLSAIAAQTQVWRIMRPINGDSTEEVASFISNKIEDISAQGVKKRNEPNDYL